MTALVLAVLQSRFASEQLLALQARHPPSRTMARKSMSPQQYRPHHNTTHILSPFPSPLVPHTAPVLPRHLDGIPQNPLSAPVTMPTVINTTAEWTELMEKSKTTPVVVDFYADCACLQAMAGEFCARPRRYSLIPPQGVAPARWWLPTSRSWQMSTVM